MPMLCLRHGSDSALRRLSALFRVAEAEQGSRQPRGRRRLASAAPILAASLCTALSGGVPVRADTLAEAMGTAYATNPTLRAARKELARADEGVSQALSFYRPQASAVAGGGYVKDLTGQENTTRAANSTYSTT